MSDTLAFVGGGQMAAALIGGLLAAGRTPASMQVAEPDARRREWLQQTYGVRAVAGAVQLDQASLLVLAVKPQAMGAALDGLRPGAGVAALSIAAGVRVDALRGWLGPEVELVRSMPNTPALLRAGISALYAPPGTGADARARAEAVLRAVGTTVWVEQEAQLDAVTALSGSGPAYYFLVTELLAEAGRRLGLDAGLAGTLARETFIGAARMVAETPHPLAELRQNVTSKGGTTEAALRLLEQAGLAAILEEALRAAARRASELGDALAARN